MTAPLFENHKLDVENSSSGCDASMNSRTSQATAKKGHQDPIPPGPNRTNSMLSRQPTFPSGTRKQKNKRACRWRHFMGVDTGRISTPTQRRDEGAPLDREAVSIECDSDSILTLISSGGRSVPSSLDPSKLVERPQFDDLRAYLPANLNASKLLEKEATRLIEAVRGRDKPPSFFSKGFFGEGTEEGYKELARLAERILSALSLCLLDNECINVESCKPLANRDRLKKLIQQAQVSRMNSGEEGERGDQTNNKQDAIFALVDYISAILARLLTQMANGKYWSDNVLAVLTQRVTKLKVLLLDMHANTLISCQAGEAALDRTDISSRLSNGILDEEECEEVLRMIDSETKEGLTTTASAEVARYCVDQNRNRSGIDVAIRYILLSLRFQNRSGLDGTSFEICSMVYATGFEDFKALLFQDSDLEYSASSDQDNLNTAYSSFKILTQTLEQVKRDVPARTTGSLQTTVEWRYGEARSDISSTNMEDDPCDLSRCHLNTAIMQSMEEIITVMIPLILTSPVAVANLTQFRSIMALTCDAKSDVQPFKEKDYSAFIRIYTNQFEADSKSWDVMRLSTAVRDGVFSRLTLISGRDAPKKSGKIANKMVKRVQDMENWVIDESGVTVTCQFQVCYIVLVAFLIAGGGLCIMAVGNRITGVDPSNLSTYLWVVAGFYLLVCKSRFVEEWPWSDFLHFRVRCRSVSELHAITGINEQFIMAKLLHDERGGSVLKTRGPYNKVFLQRDSNDGLSIDCPLHPTTLLLSGLIMLKVVTPRGHALVCLDARRGTDLKVVEHQGSQSQQHLICEDINRLQEQHGRRKSPEGIRLQLVTSKDLKWKRVQGLYKDMEAEYV
ncbi:hypothetical protein VM1G_06341 [Cytospora mali]|uniref:Uncharacterized protein n=1 Tax=Cytospora mali TaxID=578113 RepID=A0A194W1B1_CYTMA|nr:hypothetical protein VM1G_06341 [Valsa mali]